MLSEISSVFGIIGVVAFATTLVSAGACLEMMQVWSYLNRMPTIQKMTFTCRSMDCTIQPISRRRTNRSPLVYASYDIDGRLCVRMPVKR